MDFTEEYMAKVRARPATALEMTNFDHSIDEGLTEALIGGARSVHSAWDFNGPYVWYDDDTGLFYEQVWIYNSPVATRGAKTLRELMETVNDEFGWE